MNPARWRLVCLWLSQLARVLADNWLRLFVVLALARQWDNHVDQAWHLVVLLWTLPMVALAPGNGALCNSLPRPHVFLAAALIGLLAVLGGLLGALPWLASWALVAVSFAVYGPTRYAFLPAASENTGTSLPRINGLFEMGAAVATVGGILLGGHFLLIGEHRDAAFELVSLTTLTVLTLHGVTVAFAVPVRFAGDVHRPELAWQAVRGFFKDCGRIWQIPRARGCLLGLAGLRAIVLAFAGVVFQWKVAEADQTDDILRLANLMVWLMAGVAAGALVAGLAKHPVRSLGLVPAGAGGFALALALVALDVAVGPVLCLVLGVTSSFINVPLAAAYQACLPADARGNGMAARNFCDYAVTTVLAAILLGLTKLAGLNAQGEFLLLTLLAGIMAVASARFLYVEAIELAFEIGLVPLYRITAAGPGLAHFPRHGPVLIVANHCAWFDPVWLGKVLPRIFVPMMTSRFFDKPRVRWLFEHVARAIRVEESTFRRDVPEIREAIKTLDRGEALLLFPEGGLRRREDQPLKQFGQGVWRILHERPETPVVVCWIEGSWGSYFSNFNGPPTKNKPLDIRRPIRIAVSLPQTVPADVLADTRATRTYLMEQCLQARQHLGLPVLRVDKTRVVSDEKALKSE